MIDTEENNSCQIRILKITYFVQTVDIKNNQ